MEIILNNTSEFGSLPPPHYSLEQSENVPDYNYYYMMCCLFEIAQLNINHFDGKKNLLFTRNKNSTKKEE